MPGCGERGDGLGVGVEDVWWGRVKDGESRALGGAQPAGDGEWAVVGAVEEDQPAPRVGEAVEVGGDALEGGAPGVGSDVLCDEECAVIVAGDAREGGRVVRLEAHGAPRAWAQRVGGAGEAQGRRQGDEAVGGGGVGEEGVCGAVESMSPR